MRVLGNILWHVPFLGFLNALFTFLLGALLTVTVVAAPIGLGLIQLSKFLLAPFSYAMVSKDDLNQDQNKAWKIYGVIVRILYFPFGLLFAVLTIVQIVLCFCTLVGIPVALVLAKSLGARFNPVNKTCVPVAVRDELDRQKAQATVDKYMNK